jgi:glyoxylase-like metal-dependent hydrolase (beta-lactamase superfamily II)
MLKHRSIPVTAFQQNCRLLWCDETLRGVLIDPGGDNQKILAMVKEEGVSLEAIWLTHGHLDHVGGSGSLAEQLSLPIIGPHKGDDFWLQGLDQQAAMFGVEAVQGFTPDRWLQDGDTLEIAGYEFAVLHCPGHTPGHVVLVEHSQKLALVGDVLFAGSIGRTDFPRGDSQQLIDSIRTKLWSLGDDYQVLSGHGPITTIGHERQTNPFVADSKFG